MFKKMIAIAAAVAVGLGLSLVGVASTATAADNPSDSCITASQVSYTYFQSSNSGVITVPDAGNGLLCDPVWVTSVSWKYSGTDINSPLPQTLERSTTTHVTGTGTYDFGSQLTCGQGDILATYNDHPLVPVASIANFQVDSVTEQSSFHFLSEMGFTWTNDTSEGHQNSWVLQDFGCRTPGDPTATSVCTDGVASGSITVDFKPNFVYSIQGFESSTGHQVLIPAVTSATTSVPLGTYQVTVKAADGWGLITGDTTWPYQLPEITAGEDCTSLPTDALLPAVVTSTNAVCTSGGESAGTITVGQVDGEDTTPYIQYSIDGTPVTGITTSVAAGTHVVTAVAKAGSAIEPGTYSQTDGSAKFTVPVAATGEICGASLKTLAFTGTDSTGSFVLALLLLQLGLALMAIRYVLARRES